MKKTILLPVFLILNWASVVAQPYQTGHRTLFFTDSVRNRVIQTEVYYPADSSGENVPVAQVNSDRFPTVVFGHGFVMSWDAYRNIWDGVVPHGYIVAFPITETGFSPQHVELGKDLAFLTDALQQEGALSNSAFYNRVDSASCVMGHSMGGGASFLAVQFNPRITALANLSAAETNPSAVSAAGNIGIPALLIAGENDCVTPPAVNQVPMYDSLQSTCKALVTIHGGSHCQMADNNFFCSIGESSCTPAPAIARADQHDVINRFLIPWLNFQLKGNCAEGLRFDSLATLDTSATTVKNCLLCTGTPIRIVPEDSGLIFGPNPVNDFLQINFAKIIPGEVKIFVMDVLGNKKVSKTFSSGQAYTLDVSALQMGVYLVGVQTNNKINVFKMVKH